MKELLYLKDDQIKEFIQLLYYAYRETFSDPREILSKKFFGPAHLRALNLIERYPGINLGEHLILPVIGGRGAEGSSGEGTGKDYRKGPNAGTICLRDILQGEGDLNYRGPSWFSLARRPNRIR